MTPLQQKIIENFKKVYVTAYADILSEELLQSGNEWFEHFLLSALAQQQKEIIEEVENGVNKLQKYTGGSSVEPKDIRIKLSDILSHLATLK